MTSRQAGEHKIFIDAVDRLRIEPSQGHICEACGSHGRIAYTDPWPGGFVKCVYTCKTCGSGYTFPLPDEKTLDGIYRDPRYHSGGLTGFGYEDGEPHGVGAFEAAALDSPGHRGRLLDVGSGSGRAAAAALSVGWQVTALDYDPPADLPDGIDFLAGPPFLSLCALSSNSVDMTLLLQVIEHVVEPARLLGEIARVTRPGGRCVITTPNASSIGHRRVGGHRSFTKSREHLFYFTRSGLTRLAEKAGFRVALMQTRGGVGLGSQVAEPKQGESVAGAGGVALKHRVAGTITRCLPQQIRAEICTVLERT
jgi:SAM-dependent methyltransferase